MSTLCSLCSSCFPQELPMTYSRSQHPRHTLHPSAVLSCQAHFSSTLFSNWICGTTELHFAQEFLKTARVGGGGKISPYLSHSIHCHMRTVQTVTCKWDHKPARELAQQCFSQSAVCSHSWSSKLRRKKVHSYRNKLYSTGNCSANAHQF